MPYVRRIIGAVGPDRKSSDKTERSREGEKGRAFGVPITAVKGTGNSAGGGLPKNVPGFRSAEFSSVLSSPGYL